MAAWVVAGALEPGYDHLQLYISELGADSAKHPWIVNFALLAFGLSFVALARGLGGVLPARTASRVVVAALVVHGAAMVAAGLLPLDCVRTDGGACQRAWDDGDASWQQDAHLAAGVVARVAAAVVPFALARALWPGRAATVALWFGILNAALAIVLAGIGGLGPDAAEGLWQRAGFAVLHVGVVLAAIWLLRRPRASARARRRASPR